MRILGIETSCDETAVAVVDGGRRILSSVVASQADLHRRFGGVVPELASRKHVERLLPVLDEALDRAGVHLVQVDAGGAAAEQAARLDDDHQHAERCPQQCLERLWPVDARQVVVGVPADRRVRSLVVDQLAAGPAAGLAQLQPSA
jgi:hypothetical protein